MARILQTLSKPLGAGLVALTLAGTADAKIYDFNRFVSGGGGGGDPKKQQIARQAGANICLDVSENPDSPPNSVRFFIWSMIPELKSRVTTIAFDTGRHADLFSGVSVLMQPSGVKAQIVPPMAHPFLSHFKSEYWIQMASLRKQAPGSPSAAGLAPGDSIMVTATLGPGKTLAHVISALDEGANPATATNGLRVGVIALYLLGGPPPGVATIMDDGGFAINGAPSRCRSR